MSTPNKLQSDRATIRDMLVAKARADHRIVAAAAVGGSAQKSDQWSDLDLTFGVADGFEMDKVVRNWAESVRSEFSGVVLFDLPFLSTIYRVFLLPGLFQVDLSFTPAHDFGALGPRFQLLFGRAVERPFPPPPQAEHIFGLGVHHAVRGHVSIMRGRMWQAEYWISTLRDHGLMMACLRLDLPPQHGRGFDDLPEELLSRFQPALTGCLTAAELRRALMVATSLLLDEADAAGIAAAADLRADLGPILQ